MEVALIDSQANRSRRAKGSHMNTQSQSEAILAHLKSGGTVTSLSAFNICNTLRCSGRIFDLRREGHAIKDRWIETPSGKRVKEYFLDTEPQMNLGL